MATQKFPEQPNKESQNHKIGDNSDLEKIIQELVSAQVEEVTSDLKRQIQNLQDQLIKDREESKQREAKLHEHIEQQKTSLESQAKTLAEKDSKAAEQNQKLADQAAANAQQKQLSEKQDERIKRQEKTIEELRNDIRKLMHAVYPDGLEKPSALPQTGRIPYVLLDDFKTLQTQVKTLATDHTETQKKVTYLDRWRESDLAHLNARFLRMEGAVKIYDQQVRKIPELLAGEQSLRNLVNQLWGRLLDQDELFERLNSFEAALGESLRHVLAEVLLGNGGNGGLLLPRDPDTGTAFV